jgi:hypothetical protein
MGYMVVERFIQGPEPRLCAHRQAWAKAFSVVGSSHSGSIRSTAPSLPRFVSSHSIRLAGKASRPKVLLRDAVSPGLLDTASTCANRGSISGERTARGIFSFCRVGRRCLPAATLPHSAPVMSSALGVP